MSGVTDLYKMIHEGLDMTPGPEDMTFGEAWEIYSDVTSMVGARLLESRMGVNVDGADEVRLFVERFHRVARISRDMPLNVPAAAIRALRAIGRLLESTKDAEELGEFLRLSSPILNDFSEFASRNLGRFARPVVTNLTTLARAGSLMWDCLVRVVPAFNSLDGDL